MQKQPNSSMCFACGLENSHGLQITFYSDGDDRVVANYEVPEHYQGYPGVVHGGIITSMLDEALVRAFMANDPNRFFFTAKMTTHFRKVVPVGQPLKLVGTVVSDRGRRGQSKAELYGPDGELLAEAEAVVVEFKSDNGAVDLELLGWRVYPDVN